MSRTLAVSAAPSRGFNIFGWPLQAPLALVVLAVGAAKLVGVPKMVQVFNAIGVGQWLHVVAGLVEAAGAVVLLISGSAAFSAPWSACTKVGAIPAHLTVVPASAAPAIVLLVPSLAAASLRRGQLAMVI